MQTIIFTDLDGSLLDPQTYSFEPAQPALDEIRRKKIPLVLCSSKTRMEIELYRKRLKNQDPFIAENGGGVFVPRGYFPFPTDGEPRGEYIVTVFGVPYALLRRQFVELRERLQAPVRGFGDMTVEEITALTGLAPSEAALAHSRDFGEPFVFERGEDGRFLDALASRGLRWTKGRLYYAMGEHDKGKAARVLKKRYEVECGTMRTIGIGDALNDLPLLKEVDFPVLVQNHEGTYDPGIELPGLIRARGRGPEGWNKALMELLN